MLACKLCFCDSVVGKMVTSMMAPVSVFSGGLFQSRCPAAQLAADLLLPPDSAQGAAAQVKADTAAAAARRAAVRYLGTVDCRYWPEAQLALINSLRADRNECVRLEAAWALGRGCCCTRKTLEALALTISGSERDGNPIERSDRVRAAAQASLDHCLSCLAPETVMEGAPVAPEGPIAPPKEGPGGVLPDVSANYYKQVERRPMRKVVEDARRALGQARPDPKAPATPRPGSGGLVEIITRAFTPTPANAEPAEAVVQAVAPAPQAAPPVQVAVAVQPASPWQPAGAVQTAVYTPSRPVSLAAPTGAATRPAAPSRPEAAPASSATSTEVQQRLMLLRRGTPSERQRAAQDLATSSWSGHPSVTQALAACGREDPEPAVRATCLRCLAQISFNKMPQ
jgi:hypothetical protein